MKAYYDGNWERITKRMARTLVTQGKKVFMYPCKGNPSNTFFAQPCLIQVEEDNSFDTMVNRFEYYNCNREMGRYASFYIHPDFSR